MRSPLRRSGPRLGFLQLCADRRFHRKTMDAFEAATGLRPDEYWIEATPGGAPAFGTRTRASDVAHANGARVMGWAAHGDRCGGFPDATDERLREMLLRAVERRRADYPDAEHMTFFGRGRRVERLG